MLRIFTACLVLLGIPVVAFASINNIQEQDGSPSGYPWKLKVTNGTLTDNGDGSFSLATGAGGGSQSPWTGNINGAGFTLFGDSVVGGSLNLASTSGIGTTDFIKLGVGTAGGTEAMRIIHSGSVGIGSTNPGTTLDIVGTLRSSGHNTFEGVTSTGATGTGKFVFDTAPAFASTATFAGNVGIGTTNVTNPLLISSSITGGAIVQNIVATGAEGIALELDSPNLDSSGTGFGIKIKSGSVFGFKSENNGTQGSGAGAGLIGVQDDGSAIASGSRLGFLAFGGSKDASHTVSNSAIIQAFATGAWSGGSIPTCLAFQTTPSGSTTRAEIMRIDSTGNVGIGSTNPGAALDMGTAGNIKVAAQKSTTGVRYLCIDTSGNIASSASACVGT